MTATSTSPVISKSGSHIQTQDGTIHVQPYRQPNSKQLRAVISFTPRTSAFEGSGSDPFRGFYSLFWISMVLLLLRTYVNNFVQNGYPLSMVFATLFTRDATTLAISDAVLVSSTFICVPFVQALQKGYIRYYYTGQIILHIYQTITLGLAIQWTFNREWPWVQSGFFTLHTIVMLMKTYSYVATNGYLSDLARKRALTEDQLRKSTELVGGYEEALAQVPAQVDSPAAPDTGTLSVTPIGTPLSEKEGPVDQNQLRHRLNAAEPVKKEHATLPKSSSYIPASDVPPLTAHPLVEHPSSTISLLAQNLTEMDLELTSTGKNRVKFPENISYLNFLDFQMVPTLCYELEYPRTERIRPMYIFEKTVATFGTFTLLYTITEHYIMPLIPTSEQSFARSMLDLALPFMLSYLILFYIIFECICNGFAELSHFGDREFYQDWWNATSFDEYARKWNKPVHAFLLRHVYQASLSSKRISRFSATFLTFLLSALVHELVMAVVTKKIRMYLFVLQMSQIPMIFLGRLPIIRRNKVLVLVKPGIRLFSVTNRRLQIPIHSAPPPRNDDEKKPTLRENIYTIPNALTASRIISCPVLGWAILEGRYGLASGLLLYAGVTDWVDGYIARRWNMRTVLGTILDPAADKTLMTTLTVTLAMKGLLPIPLAVIILGRDVLLSFSAFYYRYISLPPPKTFARYWDFGIPSAEVRPTYISKVNTLLQLTLMGVTTVAPILPLDLSLQISALQLTVAGTTIWSGLSYVFSKDAVKILSSNKRSK